MEERRDVLVGEKKVMQVVRGDLVACSRVQSIL